MVRPVSYTDGIRPPSQVGRDERIVEREPIGGKRWSLLLGTTGFAVAFSTVAVLALIGIVPGGMITVYVVGGIAAALWIALIIESCCVAHRTPHEVLIN